MRISRKLLLPQTGGLVHKFWRAHNKAFLLENNDVKKLYLENIFYAAEKPKIRHQISVHAFCVMSNHVHEAVSYKGSSQALSEHMRIAHGRFGQIFNRKYNRQGAVAYDRPKTPLVQPNSWHQMRVHFYIEANPIRANITRNLKMYRYSSFRFYAWGIRDEFTAKLVPPKWYIALGKNHKDRQSRYRALFNLYIRETTLSKAKSANSHSIGDAGWITDRRMDLKKSSSKLKQVAPKISCPTEFV